MAFIKVNDIFDELVDENKKLCECLNVLIRFKSFVDLVSDKLRNNLDPNFVQIYDNLQNEVNDVFKRSGFKFSVKQNKTKEDIIKSIDKRIKSNNKKQTEKEEKPTNDMSSKFPGKRVRGPRTNGPRPRKSNIEYIMDDNQKFICTYVGCGSRLKSKDSLRDHLKRHSGAPKPFQCDFDGCGFTTRIKTELIGHINAHKGIKPYVCEYCATGFSSKRYLTSHIKYKHQVSDQILICEFDNCLKEFKTEFSYKNHLKFHLLDKKFVCEEPNCSFKTVSAKQLSLHNSAIHSNIRPHVCQFTGCFKTYKTAEDLRRHSIRHVSERDFKCLFEGCGKAFKTAQDLRIHSKLHSGIEFKCDWPGCEHTTKSAINLRAHQVIHTSERKFHCNWPECNKRFKAKKDLIIHMRIHNNDKRYACSWPGCQYRCTDSGNLYKHRRVHMK